jgi:hypothetical protein
MATSSSKDDRTDRYFAFIKARRREVERRIAGAETIVALLGGGGNGLEERKFIAGELKQLGIAAIVPEEAFPPDKALSLVERSAFSSDEVDLVFVNVESWGSAAEFAEFHNDKRVVQKLRILVQRKYHPVYGSSSGYLGDTYLTHEAVFGHVYMYLGEDGPEWLPSPKDVVLKISERYRQWKALSSK